MGEAGNTEIFQPKAEITPQMHRKELAQPIQEYRDLLSACFDKNGNFATKEQSINKYAFRTVWNGEHILADLLHEPEATQYQALLLGARPLFFLDANTVPAEHSYEAMQGFFEERAINLGICSLSPDDAKKGSARYIWRNVAVYNPKRVKDVLEKNKDVFGDYKGQPIEEYFNGVVDWGTVVPFIGVDPLSSYPDENWYRWEKPLRLNK